MTEIWVVFSVEFMRKVRSRIFLLATFAGVLSIVLMVMLPTLLSHVAKSSTDKIIVAGPPALRARVTAALQEHNNFHVIFQTDRLPQPVTVAYLDEHDKAAAAVAVSVRNKRLHVDVFPRDAATFDQVQFRNLVPLNVELITGAPASEAKNVTTIDRSVHPLEKRFADAKSATLARGIAFGLVFVLYFAIIIASQSVMSAVAEEKTSRIAEILVATISPVNLLTGKTLAAAALAILQIVIWVAGAIVVLPHSLLASAGDASNSLADAGSSMPAAASSPTLIEPGVIAAFAVFFILGYLQHATLYAAAASLISRTEDLGLVTTPVILPVVGAFFIAQYALVEPTAPFAIVSSFIPFVSPFVMFTRVATSSVPVWQIALALLMNLALVAVCFFVAGKIYRVGMLLYGKLPTVKQIWNAIRT
jgi:ABC-2 type transport system permease protein